MFYQLCFVIFVFVNNPVYTGVPRLGYIFQVVQTQTTAAYIVEYSPTLGYHV